MRAILLILILVVVLAIGAIATGLLDIMPDKPATAPSLAVQDGKLSVKPGEAPHFQVETGKIAIGSGEATVTVPRLEVRPAGGGSSSAQPAPPAPAQPPRPQAPQAQKRAAPAPGAVADTNATQQ